MASNYPGSLDSFDTIASDKKTSDSVGGRTHRDMHNDLGDAVESIQGELGVNPSAGFATVKARLESLEAYAAKTGAYTATVDDNTINVTSGTFTLALPAASTCTGKTLKVKNSGTGVVTLDGNSSETVEGVATFPLGTNSYVEITSTGSAWLLTGGVPDTWWRDVSGSLLNSWTLGTDGLFRIRRVGTVVHVFAFKLKHPASTINDSNHPYTAPTGFKPVAGGYGPYFATAFKLQSNTVYGGVMGMNLGRIVPFASGLASADNNNENLSFQGSFITDDTWPTSLPGSAV